MMADLVIEGVMAHLTADWLLQNDWIANHKSSLLQWGAWLHGAVHFLLLALFFPWPAALGLAVLHVLIDTRVPLAWWGRVYGKSATGPRAGERAVWEDQVLHIVLIAVVAWAVAR